MGDIIFGDKNVLGNNCQIIKIEMKNYSGSDSPKNEDPDSDIVDTEEAEFEEVFVPRQLLFFDMVAFGSEEKQLKLIAMLREVAPQIDTTSGRGWFCIYAGYRYFKNKLAWEGGFSKFFADIEALVPDLLTKIDAAEKGDARYHKYTQLMGREASAWYMDNKKLPPRNEITTWMDKFNGDKSRFAANVQIIIDVYKRLNTI